MNIRLANKFDVNYFISLAKKVHELDFITTDLPVNEEHISSMLNAILHGQGVALIAENEEPIGMIVGIIHQNLWYPNLYQMTQILFYVDEEWRHTKAGYMLLMEYNKRAKELKDKNRIHDSIIQAAEPLHEIDFSRFGYVMTDKIWKLET